MKKKRVPSDDDVFDLMRRESEDDEEVIQLGPTTPDQGRLFERIRTGITPGALLSTTFDQAVKRRLHSISSFGDRNSPCEVPEEVFDQEVEMIRNFTLEQFRQLDNEIMFARGEVHTEHGGIYVTRAAGFGRDVFGFSYDLGSGFWLMTNEMGMHAHTQMSLQFALRLKASELDSDVSCISAFIFRIDMLQTPIMLPYGYFWKDPELIRKGIADIWSWKRFILMQDEKQSDGNHLYTRIFDPDYAAEATVAGSV